MCGIIGYVGGKEAKPILLRALKSLEYRGYDSCGIAVLQNGQLKEKKVGLFGKLKQKWVDFIV